MIPDPGLVSFLGLKRAVYVACTLVVLSYILFEVLDLDGSNFPSLLAPVERSVIVAEVPSSIEVNYSPERTEPLPEVVLPLATRSVRHLRLRHVQVPDSSPLDSARSHGYRVGLPGIPWQVHSFL